MLITCMPYVFMKDVLIAGIIILTSKIIVKMSGENLMTLKWLLLKRPKFSRTQMADSVAGLRFGSFILTTNN